ncbi:MAG: preprotein translocase subunit YajC [Treponemataceae bacterium]
MNLFNFLMAKARYADLVPILMMLCMGAIFYFLIVRPQKKEQKKVQEMLNALKKGDKVVTIGGIHGTVSSVDEKTIILKVDENCKIKMTRAAIANVFLDKAEQEKDKADKK